MSMKYIRDHYGVPAKRGGRVRFTGGSNGPITGTITSSHGPHLRILFDGDKHSLPVHPTWEIEYLGVEGWDKA
jgi:hypothetical protein